MGTMIYEPSGKAREYSPLALNIYNGCDHGCKYCYVPEASRGNSLNTVSRPRKDFLKNLRYELEKTSPIKKQVLLCFLTDPYNHLDEEVGTTRETLKILLEYNVPVSILTKGGNRALRDLDLFKMFGKHIQIGCTITCTDPEKSMANEPNASLPDERLNLLSVCKKNNIRTWVSMEPVLNAQDSLNAMLFLIPYVDLFKIGKLNHDPLTEAKIDWRQFLDDSVWLMKKYKRDYYIKADLLKYSSPKMGIEPKNTNPDYWSVT